MRRIISWGLGAVAFAAALAHAGENPGGPDLAPGTETRIEGEKLPVPFLLYVPTDYKPGRRWPVVFCYHGMNNPPTTWPFRHALDGKGFLVVGMEYLENDTKARTPDEQDRTIAREIQSLKKVAAYLSHRLEVDPEQLFVGGFSMGGWMTSGLCDIAPELWAGAAIIGAGRSRRERPPKNPAALRNKPIYIGCGANDPNLTPAQEAAELYERRGAKVTFERYAGLGHEAKGDSEKLRDWLWANGPLKAAKAGLAAAQKAEQAGQLGKAHRIYQQVAAISESQEPCPKAAKAAEAIGQAAEKELADAEQALADKPPTDAARLLARLAARYEGSAVAAKAAELLRKLRAESGLAEAKGPAADAPEAPEKKEEPAPAPARSPEEQAARECRGWLSLAENYLRAGQPKKAREYLQKIVEKHGDTDWATKARQRLAELPASE